MLCRILLAAKLHVNLELPEAAMQLAVQSPV